MVASAHRGVISAPHVGRTRAHVVPVYVPEAAGAAGPGPDEGRVPPRPARNLLGSAPFRALEANHENTFSRLVVLCESCCRRRGGVQAHLRRWHLKDLTKEVVLEGKLKKFELRQCAPSIVLSVGLRRQRRSWTGC